MFRLHFRERFFSPLAVTTEKPLQIKISTSILTFKGCVVYDKNFSHQALPIGLASGAAGAQLKNLLRPAVMNSMRRS